MVGTASEYLMSTLRSDYHFDLPRKLVAQHPTRERVDSRLLILEKQLRHANFSDLCGLLRPTDLLVLNDTQVVPARLYANKDSGGKVEILLERQESVHSALCQVRASKALKTGRLLTIEQSKVEIKVGKRLGNLYRLHFSGPIKDVMQTHGQVPLPPYIERLKPERLDIARYQTVYAQHEGAVAAPTAGLHFDAALLQNIRKRGVAVEFVTLHVGAGTFSPVRVDNIENHNMHHERYSVSDTCIDAIKDVRARGGRVVAVGTTVVRTLETLGKRGVFDSTSPTQTQKGETNIFIYPGFNFTVVEALLTNFHVSESSLIMLVAAFVGRKRILNVYQQAIEERYRFFSYGDAMFIPGKLKDI